MPQATLLTFWDEGEPGLALRLSPTGNRAFYAVARRSWSSNPVWRHLGCWPGMMVKAARRAAHTMVEAIRNEAPPKPKGAMIVYLIELYIEKHLLALDPKTGEPKLRKGKYLAGLFRRVVIPAWAGLESAAITRSHIIDLVLAQKEVRPDPLYGKQGHSQTIGGPFAAVEMFRWLHALFVWLCDPPSAVSKEPLLPANPCPSSPERTHGMSAKNQQRTQFLRTSAEIQSYWRAACALPRPANQFFRVALLTGQRRSQILKLRRDMIQDIGVPQIKTMLFGEKSMKMEELHLCPLTDMVASILDELPMFEGSPWYFTYDGARPYNNLGRNKERMDRLMQMDDWVTHDMRRTLRSHMSSLEFDNGQKIQDAVLEQILSHKPQGITGVYKLYSHLKEMRGALELWEQYLVDILRGELNIELA
jgi:integrase